MRDSLPLHYLNHILRLIFGMHHQPFCPEWDSLLKKIINSGDVIGHDKYSIIFRYEGRTYEIWVANAFYSYGHIYRLNEKTVPGDFLRRPSLKVMIMLNELRNRLAEKDFQDFKNSMNI